MELREALSQISEIRAQLHRTQVFSGYRSLPVAITSLLALVTAVLQATWLPQGDARALDLWLAYAGFSALICGADLAASCIVRGRHFRQQALFVVSQFAPTLAAGLALTLVLRPMDATVHALLPGIWILLFSLGIFSAAPHLPRGLRWVSLFYLAAGSCILLSARANGLPSPESLGLTFACGQAAVAIVLHNDRRTRGS